MAEMPIPVRPGSPSPDDAEDLGGADARLQLGVRGRDAGRREARPAFYRELIEAGELTALLAGEGPDGFCQFRLKRSHYTGKPDAHIEELYIVPAHRGAGIGRTLLEATIEAAREAGATHIELTTGETDTAARGLYESSGFTNREGGARRPARCSITSASSDARRASAVAPRPPPARGPLRAPAPGRGG